MTPKLLRSLADNIFQQWTGGYLISRYQLADALREAAKSIERLQQQADLIKSLSQPADLVK